MLLETAPLSPYRCTIARDCPGGPPGTCSGGLVGIGCSRCPDGWILQGDTCEECGAGATLPLWLFFVAVVVALIAKYYALASNGPIKGPILLKKLIILIKNHKIINKNIKIVNLEILKVKTWFGDKYY